jgi:hypothetical protein
VRSHERIHPAARVARRPAIAPARTTGRSSLYGREVS